TRKLSVKVEHAAWAVRGAPRSVELAQLRARHDGMVSAVPADLFGRLPGMIDLEPVGAGISPARESAHVELRSSGVLALHVRIETWNSQLAARVGDAIHVEVIYRIGINGLAADAEIVDERWPDRVSISGCEIVSHRRDRGGVVRDGR